MYLSALGCTVSNCTPLQAKRFANYVRVPRLNRWRNPKYAQVGIDPKLTPVQLIYLISSVTYTALQYQCTCFKCYGHHDFISYDAHRSKTIIIITVIMILSVSFYLLTECVERHCYTWSHAITQTHHTRTPLDERSARRTDLYHNIHNRQISMQRRDSNPQSQPASGRQPTR